MGNIKGFSRGDVWPVLCFRKMLKHKIPSGVTSMVPFLITSNLD